MKILSAEQIKELDKFTIEHEPITSIDLMERAANKFAEAVSALIDKNTVIYVFCGMGNNGGDGLAVSRLLLQKGYKNLTTFIVKHSENGSDDFKVNEERLKTIVSLVYIEEESQLPAFEKNVVCIDAIFGNGLSRPAGGIAAAVIRAMNDSGSRIYAVDVRATIAFTFHAPKLTFLFPDNAEYVQEFKVLDIGLSKDYAEKFASPYIYIDEDFVKARLKKRGKFSHKGTYGHTLMCAGSYGHMGAAVLTTAAALRSGAGLVTAHIPRCGYNIMQISNPGAMVISDEYESWLGTLQDYAKYSSIGIGPGIGMSAKTVDFMGGFLRKADRPLIVDADALNIISAYTYLRELLPHGSILTPHPGEFQKLIGTWQDDVDKMNRQLAFSKRYRVMIVLK
jgi:NAD(P)H-hydrate epimerase